MKAILFILLCFMSISSYALDLKLMTDVQYIPNKGLNEYLEFELQQDFTYNKMIYKKGMILYGHVRNVDFEKETIFFALNIDPNLKLQPYNNENKALYDYNKDEYKYFKNKLFKISLR